MAVEQLVAFLLMPTTELQITALLADFGIKSMLAPELENDVFPDSKIEVTYNVLMKEYTRLDAMSDYICPGLLQRE